MPGTGTTLLEMYGPSDLPIYSNGLRSPFEVVSGTRYEYERQVRIINGIFRISPARYTTYQVDHSHCSSMFIEFSQLSRALPVTEDDDITI